MTQNGTTARTFGQDWGYDMRIKIEDDAAIDLHDIKKYLNGKVGVRTSKKVLSDIKKRINDLSDMPYMGRKYEDNDEYRIVGVHRYMTFYKVDEEKQIVKIHRVLHGARNLEFELLKEHNSEVLELKKDP